MPVNPAGARQRVHVAVGVVADGAGQVMITKRAANVHQGDLWEFPGGKVEAGETVVEALARELAEETGLGVAHSEPLIRIPYDYPDKRVLLDVHRVRPVATDAVPREGQALRWVAPEDLKQYPFPAANAPILSAVRLPATYCVSPDIREPSDEGWWRGLEAAMAAGGGLFQYRVPSLAGHQQHARDAVARIQHAGGRCLINADPELAEAVGADGVHLPARLLWTLGERPTRAWVGASCHGPTELARAAELEVDFAVLGPVAATASHPGEPPLGWERFRQWVEACPLPVYALGGMRRADRATARRLGGQGVAGISDFWSPGGRP